jgi:hypothetical protein
LTWLDLRQDHDTPHSHHANILSHCCLALAPHQTPVRELQAVKRRANHTPPPRTLRRRRRYGHLLAASPEPAGVPCRCRVGPLRKQAGLPRQRGHHRRRRRLLLPPRLRHLRRRPLLPRRSPSRAGRDEGVSACVPPSAGPGGEARSRGPMRRRASSSDATARQSLSVNGLCILVDHFSCVFISNIFSILRLSPLIVAFSLFWPAPLMESCFLCSYMHCVKVSDLDCFGLDSLTNEKWNEYMFRQKKMPARKRAPAARLDVSVKSVKHAVVASEVSHCFPLCVELINKTYSLKYYY